MVGDRFRPTDGTEKNRVVSADLLLPVLRHHAPMLFVIVTSGEVEVVEAKIELVFLGGGLQHTHTLRYDFLANSVSGYYGNPVGIDP